ncbi:hypothetical protein BU25DRAFT_40719 [Macroventuria anomochaeta]|uniref:Uncharacterized protein n=1 Tax=Macroventuria anomochaeta TaxID=301207 RepID=A0ACB6S4L7_9PLEO|nr:uncharacterized protein BU25DRAFT_40719 [Macroventuria anomochaeta]KAF2628149.1 hypothetical protein BU25DRAFT_40719 [Macroventuria anomochaeta]
MQLRARTLDVDERHLIACMHKSITLAATASTLHGRHDHDVNCCDLLQTRPVHLTATPQAVRGQPNGGSTAIRTPRAAAPGQNRPGLCLTIGYSAACTSDWCKMVVCESCSGPARLLEGLEQGGLHTDMCWHNPMLAVLLHLTQQTPEACSSHSHNTTQCTAPYS